MSSHRPDAMPEAPNTQRAIRLWYSQRSNAGPSGLPAAASGSCSGPRLRRLSARCRGRLLAEAATGLVPASNLAQSGDELFEAVEL
jgi:hypothetical protein